MRFGVQESSEYLVVWLQDIFTPPTGKTGLTPICRFKRHSDGHFYNATSDSWQAGAVNANVSEWDSTNMPGCYRVARPNASTRTQVTVFVDVGTGSTIPLRYGIESFIIDPKVDYLDVAISAVQTRLGTPQGASVSTDILKIVNGIYGRIRWNLTSDPWRISIYAEDNVTLIAEYDYSLTGTEEDRRKV